MFVLVLVVVSVMVFRLINWVFVVVWIMAIVELVAVNVVVVPGRIVLIIVVLCSSGDCDKGREEFYH